MIARNMVYRLCALWAISLISLCVGLPVIAILSPHILLWYSEALLTFGVMGGLLFSYWARRLDIIDDLQSDD